MAGPYEDHDPFAAPPVKPGMSSGMKILLILLIVGGLAVIVCCGVGVYFGRMFVKSTVIHDKPEDIRKDTAAIVDIEIPERFHPVAGVTNMLFRSVTYSTKPDQKPDEKPGRNEGALTLVEFLTSILGKEQREQIVREMDLNAPDGSIIQKMETREFQIRGAPAMFKFSTVTSKDGDKTEMHWVQGSFSSKSGTGMLILLLSDEEYDEGEVIKIIESIH
jgi:hypothetical protein